MQKLPLENIRVLDFTQVRMGPQLTQWLAVMGAEVIKIESKLRPDYFQMIAVSSKLSGQNNNRVGYFASMNYGKLSITLNMKHPKSIELIKQMLKHIDIVAENFRTGVMEHWGLGYEDLKKIKPDIIFYSGSGFGRTGPMKDVPAFAPVIGGFSGFVFENGYPDGEPAEPGCQGWTDSIGAEQGLFAVLAALYHRSKTGEGQYLDLSMVESELAFAPEAAIEYAMNGKVRGRVGNRDDVMAPHGCYRCKGVDKWVAIAVSNDEEWVALCKSMGNSELAKDKRFSDALCRRDNQDELDRLIEDWTRKHDHYEVMKRLQEAGVMAGASLNIEDLGSDPHLKERGFLVDIEYPDKTKIRRLASPLNLSSTGRGIYKYAPALGEHNRYVFGELMGMSDEEIKRLENEEVLY